MGKWDRRAGGEALEIAQHEQKGGGARELSSSLRGKALVGSVNASAPSEVSDPPWERGPG